MAVEAGVQGCDPHSKGHRRMSGVACDITVTQGGSPGAFSLETVGGKCTLLGGGE